MTWLKEDEACKMLGGVKPRTLREKAKHHVWPIHFTNIDGKFFQYNKQDIEKFLKERSNILKVA